MSLESNRVFLVAKDDPRRQVLARIAKAFIEQPTLRLTESQAQRLWNLDTNTCSVLLSELIAVRFLERRGAQYQLPALTDLP
jgi:hypothetical protein